MDDSRISELLQFSREHATKRFVIPILTVVIAFMAFTAPALFVPPSLFTAGLGLGLFIAVFATGYVYWHYVAVPKLTRREIEAVKQNFPELR